MASLNDLFKELAVQADEGEYSAVFEQASDILKSAPHDLRALTHTVVALIHLERYLDALRFLKQYSQADPGNSLILEKLYVYYKLNLATELRTALDSIPESDNTKAILHLKAQFLYQQGNYAEALEIYRDLISQVDSRHPLYADLAINERAVLADGIASGSIVGTTQPSITDSPTSHDLIYNEAALALASGNTDKALSLLDEAEQLAAALDDEDELIPIQLQRAFVLFSLDKTEEAIEILHKVENLKSDDSLGSIVLSNNLVASSSTTPSAVFLLKELQFPNKINELSARLSAEQRCILWKNYYRLAVKAGKRVQLSTSDGADITGRVLSSLSKAGVSITDDNIKVQAKKALKYAKTVKTIPASIAAAQLNIQTGNLDAAVSALEVLPDESRLTPGISGTLLSLYATLSSEKKATSLFNDVTSAYKGKELTSMENTFLTTFYLHFLSHPELSSEAKEILNSLNTKNPSHIISAALHPTEPATNLTPLSDLTSSYTVEDLITEATSHLQSQFTTKIPPAKVTKKRANKKGRIPATFDAKVEPDPERWLPMKDRSYYKPKKGKKKNARDTQGGSADHTTEEALNTKQNSASSSAGQKKKKKGKK
ncbi:CYFA0S04e02080g1_1 [Cyberlindnera fabianii]|uniref:Signal recognition particle subunit SRP72 n=1 Tax=Cyberlindnera fabianii TaxID=36022 RepID=A0A061AQY7_CYBFA|nr:CYFA0S04e02080g1_1 [Cyberlindnera fabianii]